MQLAPIPELQQALLLFARETSPRGTARSLRFDSWSSEELQTLVFGDHLFLFAASDLSLPEVAAVVSRELPRELEDANVLDVSVAICGSHVVAGYTRARRGVRVENAHDALARLLHLPGKWREAQLHSLRQALRAVLHDDESQAIRLTAVRASGTRVDALDWLAHAAAPANREERISYLRAEAGKGKTTTLAHFAMTGLRSSSASLPLYVPLRDLGHGAAVSWESIAARLGVLAADASRLATAVKCGLVTLLLDGLDEVSGRHNPELIRQVIALLRSTLLSPQAAVIVSGRTTEGAYFDPGWTNQAGLELPETSSTSFAQFVDLVVEEVTPEWQMTASRLPEPILDTPSSDRGMPTEGDRQRISEWVCAVFDNLGKDRSLFFVQSLACMARTRQLDGNRPLLINNRVTEIPSLYDVCILAASLACVREQDKVATLATDTLTPRAQLELLTIFAILASVDSSERALLPSPNELARKVFQLDTTNQNEEFSAVLHQMQKHALLFSAREGAYAGDWRPAFLSDWIRGALLVRAWSRLPELESLVDGRHDLRRLVARAQHAALAFRELFASMLLEDSSDEQLIASNAAELAETLRRHADEGSPEAAANFWSFFSALPSDVADDIVRPSHVPPLADFNDSEFDGLEFGPEFSSHMASYAGAVFRNCTFRGTQFAECELENCNFIECTFDDVSFVSCWGTGTFTGCEFRGTKFHNSKARGGPAWGFEECEFHKGTHIVQEEPVHEDGYPACCTFTSSLRIVLSAKDLFSGDGLGFEPKRLPGLEAQDAANLVQSRAERCLRSMLRTFFPSRVGEGSKVQARPYIRLSALGRGSMPVGSPSPAALLAILEQEGFTDGGRADHVYAPWSSVAGAGAKSFALRNELLEFFIKGTVGASVLRMLNEIRRQATWK